MTRLDRLKEYARDIIIFGQQNIFYFSGFNCHDAVLSVRGNETVLFTDSRYEEEARAVCPFEVRTSTVPKVDSLMIYSKEVYADLSSFSAYDYFLLKDVGLEVHDISDRITEFRSIKDENEINIMKQAAKITDSAFEHILKFIKPLISELDIKAELQHFITKQNANFSFEPIIVSGTRGSLPHGNATNKKIAPGEMITLDFGVKYLGYCSDFTRTMAIGDVSFEQKKIYQTVKEAQQLAVDNISAGIGCVELDKIARDYISKEGYGQNFGHGLGHGVGIDVHEAPKLNPKSSGTLKNNTIITIEPGIYIPGICGVRIEDMILISDKPEIFSVAKHDMIII